MIDLNELKFHVASRDAQGKPILRPKPKPDGWDKESPISRRSYAHAADKEFKAVAAAARDAALPPKPANWAQGSAIDHLAWFHAVKRG
jgi:hypothetical protein